MARIKALYPLDDGRGSTTERRMKRYSHDNKYHCVRCPYATEDDSEIVEHAAQCRVGLVVGAGRNSRAASASLSTGTAEGGVPEAGEDRPVGDTGDTFGGNTGAASEDSPRNNDADGDAHDERVDGIEEEGGPLPSEPIGTPHRQATPDFVIDQGDEDVEGHDDDGGSLASEPIAAARATADVVMDQDDEDVEGHDDDGGSLASEPIAAARATAENVMEEDIHEADVDEVGGLGVDPEDHPQDEDVEGQDEDGSPQPSGLTVAAQTRAEVVMDEAEDLTPSPQPPGPLPALPGPPSSSPPLLPAHCMPKGGPTSSATTATAAAATGEPVILTHAVFLPAFGALVCRHCHRAVDPNRISAHMADVHQEFHPRTVAQALADLRELKTLYEVFHPSSLAWPVPDAKRIPHLECRAGYQCLDCGRIDAQRDLLARKSTDHLRADCSKDRIAIVGCVQRWTYRGGFFQVERGGTPASSELLSVSTAVEDKLNTELLGVVKARVEEVRQMHAASKAIPRQSNEPTPGQLRTEWAKMHEWGTVLASADMALVADLKRAPTGLRVDGGGGGGDPGGAAEDNGEDDEDGEFELELHWLEQQMVDIIFHAHSRASTTHDQIRYPLNHDRDDEEAAGRRKFGVTLDSTAKTYAKEFVTLIRPLLRVSRLTRADKKRVSPVQTAYVRHKTRIDALLGAESRREIRAAFLALVAALITQLDPGPRSPSALRVCLASLGVDKGRNLAWSEPWAVSKTLSAVIYDVRALAYLCFLDGYLGSDGVNEGEATIQEAIELTRPLQKLGGAVGRVTPASSQGSGSSLGIPPTEAQLVAVERAEAAAIRHFLDARRRFLNLSSGTAVSYYHRLRTYTLKTTYRPFDRFDADEKGVTFDGNRVLYASFAPVAKGMLEDVLEAMEEVFLHRELGTEPWHVDIGSLKDNLTDTSTGYSFLAHPSNRDALKAGPSMLERALVYFFDRPGGGGGSGSGDETGDEDEGDAEKGELERRGFNVVRAKKWLRKVRKMLVRLAVLLMFVCGPAVRGTEFLFNMVKNDGDWARSNRISTGGRVFIQTSYNKSVAKGAPTVAHFMPAAVAQPFIDWLAQGYELHHHIEAMVYSSSPPSNALFFANGSMIRPDTLSNEMALATKSHGLGVAAGLRALRQIEGIVIRQKLGQRFAEDLGCLPDDAGSEETQDAAINDAELLDQLDSVATAAGMTTTGVAMIQSAAHTHRTGLHYYGNTQADVQQLTPATLDKALAASLAWHRFVGMDDVDDGDGDADAACAGLGLGLGSPDLMYEQVIGFDDWGH